MRILTDAENTLLRAGFPSCRWVADIIAGMAKGLFPAWGAFWHVAELTWLDPGHRKLRLLGREVGGKRIADFRTQSGIYVLYGDYGPLYVGAVWGDRLGPRLREHLDPKDLGGQWDRFSWFGFRRVRATNDDFGIYPLGVSVRGKQSMSVSSGAAIGDIEALVIKAFGLKNIRPAVFRGKVEWKQLTRDKAEHFLEKRLAAKQGKN